VREFWREVVTSWGMRIIKKRHGIRERESEVEK
jgi:hypothetical protein